METFEGRTAVVTGAASGIGLAMATRFARAGMNIVLADIEAPSLDTAVGTISALGVDAIGVETDVTDAAAVDALRDAALDAFGSVHLVCNNAGVAGDLQVFGSLDLKQWRWVIEVNLFGVIHGHASFLPLLLEQDEGHIVNTSSMAGHFPAHSPYGASKWAVACITEGLFHQLAATGSNVGASCLCPGWVRTQIAQSERNRPEWAAPNPLADEAEPDELSAMLRQFVTDAVASGAEPSDVADQVFDAVAAKKLWVFTHPEMVAMLPDRFDAILEDRNPVPRPLGA